ncbi:MAG TPA: DEAD/DEAH box helicase [Kofleriaceae bacterium]|nr:DEAD/DEAH box helicase [Kofleriaceae bacterium]
MPFPPAHPGLLSAIAARGYAEPTPVQAAVLEARATGHDLLVSAQTGSGKTVAFGLAIAPTLLGEATRYAAPDGRPRALVIAPTRELALQVQRELTWLYAQTGARILSCVGGMDARREAWLLSQGTAIVVGTPGRLRDHLERKQLDLSGIAAVVLDEADEMLDLGFREELEALLDAMPAERRTLLFSATLPRSITMLAKKFQRDAVRVSTTNEDVPHGDIEYQAMVIHPRERELAVVNLLRATDAGALIFCRTRDGVSHLANNLIERGFAVVAMSGELSQAERTRALQALRDGRARACVATDVAARGLDLPDLGLVVHADLPQDSQVLVHRSGRTGRAGKKGTAVVLVPTPARRMAERLFAGAGLRASWVQPPSADAIRAADQVRLTAEINSIEAEAGEDERAAAASLAAAHTPEHLALALVRAHRARLPAPEELTNVDGPRPRPSKHERDARATPDRGPRAHAGDRGPRDHGPRDHGPRDHVARAPRPERPEPAERAERPDIGARPERVERPDRTEKHAKQLRQLEDNTGDVPVWFRIDVGRVRKADPKWLIPIICTRGDITKAEIGAIRVMAHETRFQIAARAADAFDVAVARPQKNHPDRTIRTARISRANEPTPRDTERPPYRDRPAR